MLLEIEVFCLGIVLLLSSQNHCTVVQNVTDEGRTNEENEQDTTHTKLLGNTLEILQNRSEMEEDLVGPRSYELDEKNVSDGKEKWISEELGGDMGGLETPKLQLQETLRKQEAETSRDHPNQSTQTKDHHSPIGYYLRTFQLRNPLDDDTPFTEQIIHNSLTPKAKTVSLELLPPMKAVLTPRSFKLPVLNPLFNHEPKVLVKSEQWVPVPADSVEVLCGEEEVSVDVKLNFLGNGQLIHPTDLTLGGCPLVDTKKQTLHFQTPLQSCGSTMTLSEEALVYSYLLLYTPTPIGNTFILKTSPAEVIIECHYPRKHYVSSKAIGPTWFPLAAEMFADQQLHFSMQLMTMDWSSPRPLSEYFLNDVMHIEVKVLRGYHVPLRVFVDSCVALTEPDPDSEPRYEFINNHGCLVDAKLTGAKSFFLQRNQEDKLHFILQMFRFLQHRSNSVYISCRLKATALSVPIDSEHKACSFLNEADRWVASEGDNKVCACCESSCSVHRTRRSHREETALQWEETAILGPIIFNSKDDELLDLKTPEMTHASPSASLAVLCGVGAALGIILFLLLVAITVSRLHKSSLYDVFI